MNKINYLNVFTVLLFLGALSLQRLQAQNRPVVQTKFTADPAPMVHNGTVYLYTSHDEDDAPEGMGRFLMKEWLLYSSTDMVNWTDHGAVASLKRKTVHGRLIVLSVTVNSISIVLHQAERVWVYW